MYGQRGTRFTGTSPAGGHLRPSTAWPGRLNTGQQERSAQIAQTSGAKNEEIDETVPEDATLGEEMSPIGETLKGILLKAVDDCQAKYIDVSRSAVEKKNEEITKLNEQIIKQNKENQSVTEQKNNEIEKLKNKMEHQKNASDSVIKGKDSEISKLNDRMKQQQKAAESVIQEKNIEIAKLIKQTKHQQEEKERQEKDFSYKLAKAQEKIEDTEKKLENLEREKEDEIQQMSAMLQKKTDEISVKKQEIASLSSEISQLQKALNKEKQEVRKHEHQLALYRKEIQEKAEVRAEKRVCVLCTNDEKLHQVDAALCQMKISRHLPVDTDLIARKLSNTLSVTADVMEDAPLVILIAVAESRNMIICDSEPSQLGVIYRAALESNKQVFMIFMDTKYRDKLKDKEAYHASLSSLFESQKAVGELAKSHQFISVQFKEKEDIQKLNPCQIEMLASWIKGNRKS